MARVFGMSCNLIGRCMNVAQMARVAPLRNNLRTFSVTASPRSAGSSGKAEEPMDMGNYVNTSAFDKTVLVKAKMYPNVEAVPDRVSLTQMKKAREFMRIRVNVWMVIATTIGCIGVIYWGKYLRSEGHSIQKYEIGKANQLREDHFASKDKDSK